MRYERILPPWPSTAAAEPGQLGDRELGVGGAQGVHRGCPAGAHHEGDVVGLGAGQFAQARGGGVGGGVGVALDVVREKMRSRG